MQNTVTRLWERGKRYYHKLGWIGRAISTIVAIATFIGSLIAWNAWAVAMGLLGALLEVIRFESWQRPVGWALLFWALATVALFGWRRAQYYKAATPKPPPTPFEPAPQPEYEPSYTTDEIQSELLPALANLEGILNRRCVSAIAALEGIHDKYWSGLGFLDLLRGDEASNVENALA